MRPSVTIDPPRPVERPPESEAEAEPVRTIQAEPWIPLDCRPWVAVAERVLSGEFTHADGSTVESLRIGLRSIGHPTCRRAYALLEKGSRAGSKEMPPRPRGRA